MKEKFCPEWDPKPESVLGDQITSYDQLRQRCPGAHSDYLGRHLIRHEEVTCALEGTGYLRPLLRHSPISGDLKPNWRKELLPRETDFLKQIAHQVAIAIANAFTNAILNLFIFRVSYVDLVKKTCVFSL